MEETRICSKCGKEKAVSQYQKGRRQCRKCKTAIKKATALRNRVELEEQKCNKCKRVLPINSFASSSVNVSGKQSKCRECMKLYKVQERYGISGEEYGRMLREQKGLCLICQDEMIPPAVDHDHRDGKVRGLLCKTCNSGLGCFKDDSSIVFRAASYLYKHE